MPLKHIKNFFKCANSISQCSIVPLNPSRGGQEQDAAALETTWIAWKTLHRSAARFYRRTELVDGFYTDRKRVASPNIVVSDMQWQYLSLLKTDPHSNDDFVVTGRKRNYHSLEKSRKIYFGFRKCSHPQIYNQIINWDFELFEMTARYFVNRLSEARVIHCVIHVEH